MSDSGIIKKRRPGKFIPTDEQREQVVGLKAVGATDERIAHILGISPDTLTKHFKIELECGLQEVLSRIATNLFRQALAGDVTASIFVLKTRAGWSEKSVHVLEAVTAPRDPDAYSGEQLLQIIGGEG
ncbi:MAG: hypothetical protein ACYCQJ_16330 [Nitrososphaerales archaeon]